MPHVNRPGNVERDILDQAQVTVEHGREAIVTDAHDLSHVVADVLVKTADLSEDFQLRVRNAGVINGVDQDGKNVTAGRDMSGDIEAETLEHPDQLRAVCNLRTVDPDLGTVVEAMQRQPYAPVRRQRGQVKLGAVPPRIASGIALVRQVAEAGQVVGGVELVRGIRDIVRAQADPRVRIDAVLHEGIQHRAGRRHGMPSIRPKAG